MKLSALTLACIVGSMLIPSVAAQQSDGSKELQSDIATLKQDVKALREQQQQILNQLGELTRLLQTGGRTLATAHPPATVSVREEPFQGDKAARVAIIEYGDFECPVCGRYSREIYPHIVADYIKTNQIKYFYRDLPLPMHPRANSAARASHCAGEQGKFWEMHDSLLANQTALSDKDILERGSSLGLDSTKLAKCFNGDDYNGSIQRSGADAQGMGIIGTPTFLLGTVSATGDEIKIEKTIPGAYPYATFKAYLDELLLSKKQ